VKFSKAGKTDSVFVQTVATTGCASVRKGVNVTSSSTCSTCVVTGAVTGSRARNTTSTLREQSMASPVIKAYPNPNTGSFNLSLAGFEQGKATLKVTDVYGSVIFLKQINAGLQQQVLPVDLGSAARGVYMIQVIQNNRITALRVTKE
jgi:hypothetical protein